MNIPKSIKIGTRTVNVEYKRMEGLYGQYNPQEMTLTLNPDQNKYQMVETFWHELIHAIHDYTRINVELRDEMAAMQMDNSDPEMRSFMLEERMTESFATAFLQVIQDNNLLAIK